MILRHYSTLGDAAGDAAYKATYAATGSFSQAEAASRNATQNAVAYYSAPQVISNPTPAPVVTVTQPPPIVEPTPTRQTIQPVASTVDAVSQPSQPVQVVTTPPPPVFSSAKTVNPLIPNVTYTSDSPQVGLTQVDPGAGVDVPPEYTNTDVVATPTAPAVSSTPIPWGLLLSASFAAYEFMTK